MYTYRSPFVPRVHLVVPLFLPSCFSYSCSSYPSLFLKTTIISFQLIKQKSKTTFKAIKTFLKNELTVTFYKKLSIEIFPTHSKISLISQCVKLKKLSCTSFEKLQTNIRNTILWVPLTYLFMLVKFPFNFPLVNKRYILLLIKVAS